MEYREYLTEEIRRVRAKVAAHTDPLKKSMAQSYLNRLLAAYKEGIKKGEDNSREIVIR